MGPWFIRDEANPFLPGCSLQTLRILIKRGKVTRDSILRGPSTRQFWTFARNAPGIANQLGECHACHAESSAGDTRCAACGASFEISDERERLGLSDVRLLPGHAAPEQIADANAPAERAAPPLLPPAKVAPVPAFTPFVGIDDPHEAQALIASRQRQRRSRQRLTIAVVLTALAIGFAGIALSIVLSKRGQTARTPAPARPTAAPAPTPAASHESATLLPQPPAVLATPDAAPTKDSRSVSDPALKTANASTLAELESSDSRQVEDAIRKLAESGTPSSPRLDAAVKAAKARLFASMVGSRL